MKIGGYFGRDVFVASLMNVTCDGRAHSFATWSVDLPTSLPRAEAIVFYRGDAAPMLPRRWHDVVSVCGALMEAEDVYPPRFYVPGGPSAEQLLTLERAFDPPPWLVTADQGEPPA
jgi:hypothetical protein